jgi:outer membrane protein
MPRSFRSLFPHPAVPAIVAATAIAAASISIPAHADPPPGRRLTLAEAVGIARSNVPLVHAAFARLASAEASVARSRAGYLPTLSATSAGTAFASQGRIFVSGVESSDSDVQLLEAQGGVNLSWTLYDFGHTHSAVAAAGAAASSATCDAQAAQQQAMGQAAVAYYTLLADDEYVEALNQAEAERDRVLTITRALVESAIRSPIDATRAQVAVDVAKLDVSIAEGARVRDSSALAAALALDPTTPLRVEEPAPVSVDERATADGKLAVSARREVAAARARLGQARHALDAARRAHLPSLGVQAQGAVLYSYSRTLDPTQNVYVPAEGPSELASGTLTLTVPLFDRIVNSNEQSAEAGVGEAEANLEQRILSTRTEAVQASEAVMSARKVLEQAERLAGGTAEALSVVEVRYQQGMEGPLVLADAQREDILARVTIVRARLELEIAKVKLLEGMAREEDLMNVR